MYVLSGVTARDIAGPAVILSYVLAAMAALLSALSYAEFAVDLPVAGGAFNFIALTFGELAAWRVSPALFLGHAVHGVLPVRAVRAGSPPAPHPHQKHNAHAGQWAGTCSWRRC